MNLIIHNMMAEQNMPMKPMVQIDTNTISDSDELCSRVVFFPLFGMICSKKLWAALESFLFPPKKKIFEVSH